MAGKLTLSVSQLNEYVRRVLQLDPMLHGIRLSGEISNVKLHQTGTLFFTLKDEQAAISCVMYAQAAQQMQVAPFEGMRVVVSGSVGLYARGGQYQFYADTLQAQGVGVLYERLLALKEKLSAEGLFEKENKLALPAYVDTIGVVSSPTGAVIHDIMSVSLRRDPTARILLCPVRVQGAGSAQEVAQAIELLDRMPNVSVIIVARGGGSIEDLWTFNEEAVVRAVAACSKPIVSAVGHETDVTLCDLAADLRAPTPSAAAECVVAVRADVIAGLREYRRMLTELMRGRIERETANVAWLRSRLAAFHPRRQVELECVRLQNAKECLLLAAQAALLRERARLDRAKRELALLSPYQVLSRGYALVRKDGRLVASAASLHAGDVLEIRFGDGTARASVLEKSK